MKVLAISSDNYEAEIEQSNLPVIVDFWASWCMPCRAMSPVVDSLAEDLDGKVKVCKVNIDQEPELAAKYRVMSIPTIMLIEDNQVKATVVGAMDKESLLEQLDL